MQTGICISDVRASTRAPGRKHESRQQLLHVRAEILFHEDFAGHPGRGEGQPVELAVGVKRPDEGPVLYLRPRDPKPLTNPAERGTARRGSSTNTTAGAIRAPCTLGGIGASSRVTPRCGLCTNGRCFRTPEGR